MAEALLILAAVVCILGAETRRTSSTSSRATCLALCRAPGGAPMPARTHQPLESHAQRPAGAAHLRSGTSAFVPESTTDRTDTSPGRSPGQLLLDELVGVSSLHVEPARHHEKSDSSGASPFEGGSNRLGMSARSPGVIDEQRMLPGQMRHHSEILRSERSGTANVVRRDDLRLGHVAQKSCRHVVEYLGALAPPQRRDCRPRGRRTVFQGRLRKASARARRQKSITFTSRCAWRLSIASL